MENRTQKFCSIPMLYFQRFDHGAALQIERKMSHLNIAFDRYASTSIVMHYILVISKRNANQTTTYSTLCLLGTVLFLKTSLSGYIN